MMMTLAIILATAVAIYVLYKRSRRDMYELAAKLHGPETVPLIGNALIFAVPQKELLRKFVSVDVLYESPTRYWLGPQLYVSIDKPEHVQVILSTQTTIKGDVYKMISDCIGFGLIQSEGLKHKTHRKIMSLPLRDQVLEKYIDIFDSKGRECAVNLGKYVDGGYFDVVGEVEKTTMAVVCETILGVKMESNNAQNEHLIKIISGYTI
ncbi:cytochrome P450 4C1-like [Arctopsyche grandis]|uniref:cytochrome P450 4C1-like n=1 Tax=Arctopsyche grandis TaxID=121162 RepID=UPI00406D6956